MGTVAKVNSLRLVEIAEHFKLTVSGIKTRKFELGSDNSSDLETPCRSSQRLFVFGLPNTCSIGKFGVTLSYISDNPNH